MWRWQSNRWDRHMQRSAQLESEASRARAELKNSIEELRTSMSPSNVFDRLKTRQQEAVGDFAKNIGRNVRENPWPYALGGVALAAFLGRRMFARSTESEMRERLERLLGDREDLSDRISRAAEAARSGVKSASDWASDQLASADIERGEGFLGFVKQHPLWSVALGLGISAMATALLPSSARRRWSTERAREAITESPEAIARAVREESALAEQRLSPAAAPTTAATEGVTSPSGDGSYTR